MDDGFLTDAAMDSVEKMLTRYIEKTIMGVRADYFRKVMKINRIETSLEAIADMDEQYSFQPETICDYCFRCQNDRLCAALDGLTERQEFVLIKIYAEKYTEDEVAKILGVSQQTVHFHKNNGLARLRVTMSSRMGIAG